MSCLRLAKLKSSVFLVKVHIDQGFGIMATTKITQIEDKGATIAWSPNASHPDIIALGTKVRSWGSLCVFGIICRPCILLMSGACIFRILEALALKIQEENWTSMI